MQAMVKIAAKRGARWQRLKTSTFSKKTKELHKEYLNARQKVRALGAALKAALEKEWNEQHPQGLDGQICSFNITNGALLCVMKDIKKPKHERKQPKHERK